MTPPTPIQIAPIQISGITSARGGFTLTLDDWQAPAGAVIGLIGPNGAGKTTLLELISGQRRPDSGQVRVFGMDPAREVAAVRARLSHMTDDQALFPVRIRKLLRLISGYYPTWDAALVDDLLDRFQLDPAASVTALSRGQGTRLRLILALAHRPDVLLLDEPGIGLDLAGRRELLRAVLDVAGDGERTVIISSHQLSDVERIADALLVLDAGRAVRHGPTDTLVADGTTLEENLQRWGATG